jgi:hypothetical protein
LLPPVKSFPPHFSQLTPGFHLVMDRLKEQGKVRAVRGSRPVKWELACKLGIRNWGFGARKKQ